MVSFVENSFRAAVAVAAGLPLIHDVIWEREYDRVLEERFRTAKGKAERDEVVRKQAGYVRSLFDSIVSTGGPPGEASRRPSRDDAGDGASDVLETGPEQSEPFTVTLSEYEQDRAWAYSLEIAALADRLYGNRIQRFRHDKLHGQLLSEGDAEAWLLSDNARLALHRTMVESTATTFDGELTLSSREVLNPRRQRQQVKLPSGEVAGFEPGSPVSQLYHQGELLSCVLPWEPEEAAWFILTGQPPPIHPLLGTFSRTRLSPRGEQRGVITIEVEPWVSEKTVTRLYHDVRARAMPRHEARHRGLAVWCFVESLHAADRPTLLDVKRELSIYRPANFKRFRTVWQRWLAAHSDLESMTITDAFERWNKESSDDATKRFRHYGKFRQALVSGIDHASTITHPGYRMLSEGHSVPQ